MVTALREMVRGCCCCCCWCVQSTPVKPRAVRSIEARGYYAFLGGGHPASPSLHRVHVEGGEPPSARYQSVQSDSFRGRGLIAREIRVRGGQGIFRVRGVFVVNFVSSWWILKTFHSCSRTLRKRKMQFFTRRLKIEFNQIWFSYYY